MQAQTPFLKAIGKSRLLGEEISKVEGRLTLLFSLLVSRLTIGTRDVMMDLFFLEYTLRIGVLGLSAMVSLFVRG